MKRFGISAAAAAAAVVTAVMLAHSMPATPEPATTTPAIGTPDTDYSEAARLAGSLSIIDTTTSVPDYRRDEFGDGWADLDQDGCNTRQEILHRDLDETVVDGDGCRVLSGILHDPYTGTTITFQHDVIAEPGNPGSQGVQIEHILSLAQAWEGGAWSWTETERLEFANAPDVLIAVDGPTNAGKGALGPSQWLPTNPDYVCDYASAYTAIAHEWDIAVEISDRDALVDTLTRCATTP